MNITEINKIGMGIMLMMYLKEFVTMRIIRALYMPEYTTVVNGGQV